MLAGVEQREREKSLRGVAQNPVHGNGPALAPTGMSKSRFNATLCNGNAVGLTVDVIPLEGVTRCGIQDIDNQKISNTRQAFFLKRRSPL